MRISDPVLVCDISDWCDHINTNELEDAGVESVIVGMYFNLVRGKWELSRKSRQHCETVAKSSMVLQAYVWYDITLPPVGQAQRYCDTLLVEGLPIKFTWADLEQWWSSWSAYYAAQKTGNYYRVPRANKSALSAHMSNFVGALHGQVRASGVYTNKGFVDSWAPGMNAWLPDYLSWVPQYGDQPNKKIRMSWEQLKMWMPDYDIDLAAGQHPDSVCGHQFTGDRCLLPGSYNMWGVRLPMDVSIFNRSFIAALRGSEIPLPPVPEPADGQYRMISGAWPTEKPGNQYKATRHLSAGDVVTVVEFSGEWAKLAEGDWVYRSLLQKVAP